MAERRVQIGEVAERTGSSVRTIRSRPTSE